MRVLERMPKDSLESDNKERVQIIARVITKLKYGGNGFSIFV
ncbi:hypothetical protein Vsou_22230 [Vulcanisaeta souniana JCM 11219]|uniref:Uncharacterized protein n=1 Tax=Vulcanisaeta souniana JCM 11219 TaxID=1293586 RepID=A0ABM8BQ83_9CREN|nr:hypothetical protein Vsou_22230 [Vulcanisaeta souniana JCM 11219]